MKVPTGSAEAETVVRRSRFIAFAEPIHSQEEARALLKAHKARYPDASHVCHAFALGKANSLTLGCGDDGEVAGTAGRPMLEILKGSGATNLLVTVVRYFGGTKLGTGGLVQAYGDAARAVLERVPLVEDIPLSRVRLAIDHARLIPLKRRLDAISGHILSEVYGVGVVLEVELPSDRLEALRAWHGDAMRGSGEWEVL